MFSSEQQERVAAYRRHKQQALDRRESPAKPTGQQHYQPASRGGSGRAVPFSSERRDRSPPRRGVGLSERNRSIGAAEVHDDSGSAEAYGHGDSTASEQWSGSESSDRRYAQRGHFSSDRDTSAPSGPVLRHQPERDGGGRGLARQEARGYAASTAQPPARRGSSPGVALPVPVKDIAGYVEQLETQNGQLRSTVMELQELLYAQQQQHHLLLAQQPPQHASGAKGTPVQRADEAAKVGSAPQAALALSPHGPAAPLGGVHPTSSLERLDFTGGGAQEHFSPLGRSGILENLPELASEEDKQRYLESVLAQVRVMVQAHRSKCDADLQMYKSEAEAAKRSLKQLREALALEGLDLAMLPALVSSAATTGDRSTAGEPSLILTNWLSAPDPASATKSVEPLVAEISRKLLSTLLDMEAGDDVPRLMEEAVSSTFHGVVSTFASQLETCVKCNAAEVRRMKDEWEEERRLLSQELQGSDKRRSEQARKYDAQIAALRDEIHVLHAAASQGDDIKGSIHERSLDEYAQMLMDTRLELEKARRQLEEVQNSSAEQCMRLKAALQRRNTEFEAAILGQARASVEERDQRIAQLEARHGELVKQLEDRETQRRSIGVQAGSSVGQPLYAATEANYVRNLLAAFRPLRGAPAPSAAASAASEAPLKAPHHHDDADFDVPSTHRSDDHTSSIVPPIGSRASRHGPRDIGLNRTPVNPQHLQRSALRIGPESATNASTISFEQDVWEKTQELLKKYGRGPPSVGAAA